MIAETGKVTLNCAICTKPFTVWRCRLAEGRGKHCSPTCQYEARRRLQLLSVPFRSPFIEGGIAKVPLTKGLFAIIDIADIPAVSGQNWYANRCNAGNYYATNRTGNKHIYLHRWLMAAPANLRVDHKDGDTLNDRRENLRICTHQQNLFNQQLSASNTSGKTGVGRYGKNWTAQITANGRVIHLGSFVRFEDAVAARVTAEKKYFGEFARMACSST